MSLLAATTTLALATATARANPAEVFGFGSRQAAMGGAAAARVDDFSSVYYNPAGLAASHGKHVSFGLLGAASHLAINDRSYELSEPFGFSFGARMANHVGCKRPDLARAIVAGGGDWVDHDPKCGAPLPVLVIHRTRDPSELVSWGREAAERWAKVQHCDASDRLSQLGEGCTEFPGCAAGGSVGWCEDPWFDPSWPQSWNHTVRDNYRALAWDWFRALPPG